MSVPGLHAEALQAAHEVLAMDRRVAILGTRVTACTFAEAGEVLAALVERRIGVYVSPATVYSVMLGYDDAAYRDIVNRAALVTPDGMPLVWGLNYLGRRTERVHNDDLFLAICRRYPQWRHFLVGGRVGQPEQVAQELAKRFPGIQVVGFHPTPLRPVPPAETEIILEKIRAAQPGIVWAGLGTPAQDLWMEHAAPRAGVPMVGVGSVFDLLAGRTKEAPEWMKRGGLQWLFRLSQEPRRLARRYLHYNSRFLVAFGKQLLRASRPVAGEGISACDSASRSKPGQ